jgi:Secretion system C-terminal sorting domain
MKKLSTLIIGILSISSACFAQIETAGSYLDITRVSGGPVVVGDVLEIRAVIGIPAGTTITKLTYTDLVPTGTSFINGSLTTITNEGVVVGAIPNTGTYTNAAGDDRGQIAGSAITIHMGTGATSATGGSIIGGSTTPVFFNVASILMAAYRVTVTAAAGSIITLGGTFNYKSGVNTTVNLANTNISVLPPASCSASGVPNLLTAETNGGFGSGTTQNRAVGSPNVTGFTFTNLSTNQPGDNNYCIIKNTSPTQFTVGAPAAADRVFGKWDVIGDHTGTLTAAGNAPAANGVSGGYMLAVNASYAPANLFSTTINGIVPNTSYTVSFWMRNICSVCGGDPTMNAGSGTPGVKPNLAFSINGVDYYNTGEVAYTNQWVQKSFTFNSFLSTTFVINIKNNAPGGGGNDWVLDDISLTQCFLVLPVTLTGFEGIQVPGGVALNWQTADEKNISYFDIVRSSDNNNFEAIGRVDAHSLSNRNSYHFTDKVPSLKGTAYYRLRMVDTDGKFTYSKIIVIKESNTQTQTIRLLPNPARSSTALYMVSDDAGTARISLWNIAGIQVYTQTANVSKGQNTLMIQSLAELRKGMYVVKVIAGNKTSFTKLIIE